MLVMVEAALLELRLVYLAEVVAVFIPMAALA
jgi:hypothetical protein